MAVWGTPVAREDDAERAVRAALELVDAVAALQPQVGAADLRARAGVVTGQAALLASQEEGVVVGDRVNTAARVQAAAEPGSVLVDDVTRQVTSTAIVYEDAGHHELKGKSDPLRLWRAVEAVGALPGESRDFLQAQFVGRDPDLRLVKELFHAGVHGRTVRLVAISGPAGVGKSRLRGEFLAYLMTLPDRYLWHPGRCLPYGDGVAYWALAEMVRHRLGIPEDARAEDAAAKLEAGLERWVGDPAERELISPRVGVLLGVADAGPTREELFAGWRLFFERLAEHDPVVMAFEDMHWAEDGLLDFIEYLLDWSAQHRIFILTFARPELAERRPGWPAGRRSAAVGYLEPLGNRPMEELLDSVATLPEAAKRRIISHAEGIPLYAIETVRALLDRGALVERDGALVLAGELGELDVPPSLISLLGARLDALAPDEREMVKTMSVFGGNFPLAAAQALSELPAPIADAVLRNLVRKQVLTVRSDPLSPDRGQYRFAQMLLRTVAYDLLSKRERKIRHLAAANYLSRTFANEGEDVAEVVAAHYLQAYRCAASDSDALELRAEAVNALRRGAQRAAAVGAPQTAERAYAKAIDLAGDEDERVELTEAAGDMALLDGRYEDALALFDDAATRLEAIGRERQVAGLAVKIGHALRRAGRTAEAIDRMQQGLAVLSREGGDSGAAELNVELGGALLASGYVREAAEPLERALELAQAYELPNVLAGALTYKAQLCVMLGRSHEASLLFEGAIELCRRHELTSRLIVVLLNSGDFLRRFDLPSAAERLSDALAVARQAGSRVYESVAASSLMLVWYYTGKWDDVQQLGTELLEGPSRERPGAEYVRLGLTLVSALRGELAAARQHLGGMTAWQDSGTNELRWTYVACEARIALAAGDLPTVLELEGASSQASRIGFPCALDAALELGQMDQAAELLALLGDLPPGHVPPFLRAQVARGRGLLALAADDRAVARRHLAAAAEVLGALGYAYSLAQVRTDLGMLLMADGEVEEARGALDEAIATFGRLRAGPALERTESVLARLPVAARSG
jgi:tetratricopeptide (TPR) repeat protein